MIHHLVCVECGRAYQHRPGLYHCPECGLPGILDVIYDYDAIARRLTRDTLARNPEYSMWRYLPLLPLAGAEHVQPLHVGWTPLTRTPKLESYLGIRELRIKDDGRNPTGSFKDRASAVGVAKALEEGQQVITCASTGNAASSLAGFAAAAGLRTYIFVPANTPEPKVAQLLIYGANVLLVSGSYDDAYYLCNDAARTYGWYNRNCAINPYLIEGKKTVGLEIAEQMNWQVPDWVVMSVGDGCSIAGAWKAFSEMHGLGLIDRIPHFLGVQADGADPIVRAFNSGGPLEGMRAYTTADSIAVGRPRNATKAMRGVRSSGGAMLSVSDPEILEAIKVVAARSGVFTEPAGAAAFAGLIRARQNGIIGPDESVVVVATGNGLKDVRSALRVLTVPPTIAPTLEAVAQATASLQ